MLKHFNRRHICPMIRVIRLEINTSRGSDELHDPWRLRLQDMRILCCIHQSSEEEVRNVDWPRHAEVVKYVLHDANDFFSNGFIAFNGAEGLRQNPIQCTRQIQKLRDWKLYACRGFRGLRLHEHVHQIISKNWRPIGAGSWGSALRQLKNIDCFRNSDGVVMMLSHPFEDPGVDIQRISRDIQRGIKLK